MRGRLSVALAGVLTVALLSIGLMRGAGFTEAAWTDPERAVASVTGATLVAPTGLTCATSAHLVLGQKATLTWPAVPGATGYMISVWDPATLTWKEFIRTTAPSYELKDGLLGGLLGGLLDLLNSLLGGGGTATLAVRTTAGTAWMSGVTTQHVGIKNSTALLGGYVCAPPLV